MTTYLYEQDLVPQKYRILVAMRHDSLVRKIALELNIPVQELRRYLIEHLDMIQLENLPARAEMAEDHADQGDAVAQALGREKYTVYLQILSGAAMDAIFREVDARVHAGTPVDDAIAYGRIQIREALKL
jgi:energy-converting hydrogenase A subunit M